MSLIDFIISLNNSPVESIQFRIPTTGQVRKWMSVTGGIIDKNYMELTVYQQKFIIDDIKSINGENLFPNKIYPPVRSINENLRRERDCINENSLPSIKIK